MDPVITPLTEQSFTLRNLPAPTRRIPVAVYGFPDMTGQYRERQVQTLSRAVTQGGAPMLIKALQDAGERQWFSVIDRARLDDVLKERQIVTEMRRIYRNEEQIDPDVLAPLNHAGVIMQGGIVGFDTNSLTGGAGARYLGIGGDTEWQQDTVTVSLRAVSTETGEVLASVMVHKMVASYSLQGGAFRYVALDRLLELEAGVTQNEPMQIAVQQAIEKAVAAIIIEGAELGVWSFANEKAGREVIDAHNKEKYGTRMSETGRIVPPPETRDAASVVDTKPLPRARRQPQRPAGRQEPRGQQPRAEEPAPPPPPPEEDEVLGSATEDPGRPPAPAEGEVVGAIDSDVQEARVDARETAEDAAQGAAAENEAAGTEAQSAAAAGEPVETAKAGGDLAPAASEGASPEARAPRKFAAGQGFSPRNDPQPYQTFE